MAAFNRVLSICCLLYASWTDADGDGYAEQLQLVWKADGTPISSIDPELAGELAFNLSLIHI